jgi:hypothetical protein
MSADTLLSKLDGVRCTGPGRWLARCAGHVDRSPSLSIRELDDGRVLVKCFAEYDVESILSAVGLGWDAIMPPRAIGHHVTRERRPFNAHDVLVALETELTIASVATLDIAKEKMPSEVERERLLLASRRIRSAIEMATENA